MGTTTNALETIPMKAHGPTTRFCLRRFRPYVTLVLAWSVLSLASMSVNAQEMPGLSVGEVDVPVVDPTTAESIAALRAAVVEELEKILVESNESESTTANHRDAVRSRLQRIEAVLGQQMILAASVSAVGHESPTVQGLDPSAYALNVLYEARWSSQREESLRAIRLASSREVVTTAKENYQAAERKRREARGELEKAAPGEREDLQRTLELRQLDSRIALEEVNLRTLETRAAQGEVDATTGVADFDERIHAMREELARDAGSATASFEVVTQREGEVQRSREMTARRLTTANLRLETAANRLSKLTDPSADSFEEVEALTARRDAIKHEIELSGAQLERLSERRKIWQQWEALLRGEVSREEMGSREAAAVERIAALKQTELQRQWRATDLQLRLDSIEGRLAGIAEDTPLRRALEEQRDALGRLQHSELAEVAALGAELRLLERYRDDLNGNSGRIEPVEYLLRSAVAIRDVWAYEITSVDDAPISVGSLAIAISLFSMGLWASRKGSAFVGRVSQQRLKLDAGAAHAFETLSFYALFVGLGLLALRAVHFPLTAFTVLGGALAIGIGFGSQNVMNNFISGLILMLERPVRARDLVEVDGNHGVIEHIGARSTRIRSTDGRHIIVPNSFFLESNVINWTLSDDIVRTKVTVGVIYGSPTRLVEQLIARVVDEEEKIIKSPAPIVVFDEFGDNSLNFDVYFWVRARSPMDMRRVQSRVRYAIDDLFREHNLVIAFPQRDVHLDTVSPLEVRMVGAGESKSSNQGSGDKER